MTLRDPFNRRRSVVKMSAKQAYVLANLERVRPLRWKLAVRNPSARYQLDGWECTAQITGLAVRGFVEETDEGTLVRLRDMAAVAPLVRDRDASSTPAPSVPGLAHATTDMQGRFTGADARFCELLGCTPENLFGLTILDVTHEEDRTANRLLLERLRETGTPFDIRKRYRRRGGGATVWVENHVARLIEEDGAARLVASVRLVDGPELVG